MTGCYGQDWASYQGYEPDTTGLSFVFVKATQGLAYVNPRAARQVAHARLMKLTVGHYHYPAMMNSPAAEADFFLSKIDLQSGDVLSLDWEGYDAANRNISMARQIAYKTAWLAYVRAKHPTHQVGTYANVDYLKSNPVGPYGDFLWIATADLPAGEPGIAHSWLFHQYGAKNIDRDYCPLTPAALRGWAHFKEDQEMTMTKTDAQILWAYVHGTEQDMHAQLVSANTNAAAAFKAITTLDARLSKVNVPEIDYAKLAAALISQLKG